MSNRRIIFYLLLLASICFTAYTLFVFIPGRAVEQAYNGAKQIGKDIRDAFQITPEITINNTVVLQKQADILELSVISQQFSHEYDWTNRWMGSTKHIVIKGSFEAKAGFDLQKQFRIDITENFATVTLSEPTLLSLTPQPDISFADENGIWNWVSPDDRTAAINAFNADATRYAQQAEFIADAKKSVEAKIRTIMGQHGKAVEIRYDDRPRIELR